MHGYARTRTIIALSSRFPDNDGVLCGSRQTGRRPLAMGSVQVYRAQHRWHDRQLVHVLVPGTRGQPGDDRQRGPCALVPAGHGEMDENGVRPSAGDRAQGGKRIAAVVHP